MQLWWTRCVVANSSSAYLFILQVVRMRLTKKKALPVAQISHKSPEWSVRLLINAAGSKVETLLVAFQTALYHVRSRSYTRLHTCRDTHSLPYARNVLNKFASLYSKYFHAFHHTLLNLCCNSHHNRYLDSSKNFSEIKSFFSIYFTASKRLWSKTSEAPTWCYYILLQSQTTLTLVQECS